MKTLDPRLLFGSSQRFSAALGATGTKDLAIGVSTEIPLTALKMLRSGRPRYQQVAQCDSDISIQKNRMENLEKQVRNITHRKISAAHNVNGML